MESQDGSGALRMDQLLSSFAERRFGACHVRSEWITLERGRTMLLHRIHLSPSKTVQGKRTGLVHPDAQLTWLARKGEQHGFDLPVSDTPDYFDFVESPGGRAYADARVSQDQMLTGRRHDGTTIRVFLVLYEGRLTVRDPAKFCASLKSGIGHGKVMGLGLLSVATLSR